MAINIGVLSPYPSTSASSYLRIISPLKYLSAAGKVKILDMLNIGKTGIEYYWDNFSKVEVVILQRHFPSYYATNCPEIPLSYLLKDKKVIFECDDLLSNLDGYIKSADLVTVSTAVIKNHYQKINQHTVIIPNRLDSDLWSFTNKPVSRMDDGKLRLLFGGSMTHQEDINFIEPVIQELLKLYRDKIEFVFWGDYPPTIENRSQIKIIAHQRNYLDYAKQLQNQQIDLAVIPLLPTAYNEAKSNIKFLEYSICKIPGVYSDLAPYREVEHGQTGILADYDLNNWLNHIIEMLENAKSRKSIAECAYQYILENYDLESHNNEWNQIFDSL